MKTNSMLTKNLAGHFLVVLALNFFTFPTCAEQASSIWRVKADGRSAEAQFSDALGGGRINAFQNGGSTFLFYEIWGNDPTSQVCVSITDQFGNETLICVFTRFNYDYGWGEIPSADLPFTATNAHLLTTTGTNFSNTRCTTDTSGPSPVTTCTNGSPLTFDLTWQPNNSSRERFAGVKQRSIASLTFTTYGKSETTSASVTGHANGRKIFNAPGRLGDIKGKHVATVTAP